MQYMQQTYNIAVVLYKVMEIDILMVSCQKGPTRNAYEWPIGPYWQDTFDM